MSIDISKLQGDWKQWATEADEHKKGSKDTKVNSAFEEAYVLNAAFDAGKSVEEVAQIFGAEFAKTYGDKLKSNDANINTKSDVAKDAEKDILERYLVPSKEDFVANPNWQDYSKALRNKILSPDNTLTNRGYYKTLLNQIDQVTDAMSGIEYNSRDDVKDLYDKVKEKLDLDKKDKFKDFKLDVLKEMVELAEAHQKDKEKNLVLKEYNRLRKGEKKSREEAIDIIQNSDEFKGSYFHDYWKKGFNKGLIHQVEDDKVRAEARKVANDAIEAQRRQSVDTPRSSRQIEKDVRADLKKDGELDKYTKRYLNGEMSLADRLAFERSRSKSLRKEIATDEKVEHRKTISYTAKEIKDKLNNDLIFEGLLQKGYITDRNQPNEDNEPTYDLTVLSDKIRGRLGADLRANKQTSNLRPYSEVDNVVKEILADSNLGKVSSSDAKKLVKLCGFEIEGKNWVKITANALLKTIPNGIGTAVGVGLGMTAQVYDKIHPLEVNVNNKIHAELDIKIKGGDAKVDKLSLMRSLVESGFKKENIQLIEIDGGFKLIIDRLDSQSYDGEPLRFTEVMPKRLGETVLKTMMVNFALNFVQEAFADNQGEIPVTTTQFQHKSIKEYCSFIDADRNMTKAQKESLKQLAEAYIQLDKKGHIVKDENGEPVWNVEDFKLCLDKMAGSESMLNKLEFYIGVNAALRESNEKLANLLIEAGIKDSQKPNTDEITTVKNQKPDEVVTVPHTWNNESWQAVVATYYPEAYEEFKGNLKPLVDAFRKAQGISFKSGIPKKGTKFNLDVININGKEYSPKADSDGSRLAKYTSNKEYGWGSKYFNSNWKHKSKGRAQSTVGERKVVHETTYTSTRKSDNQTNTGKDEKVTQEALMPTAQNGVETEVTIQSSDGSRTIRKIKPKE